MPITEMNEQALLRLYAPWEEPDRHRQGDEIIDGRRPSQLAIPKTLRGHVNRWRELGYEGASETSRVLLTHWFRGEHLIGDSGFRYYFCQREAIETLVYLYEVERTRTVSGLISEYGSPENPLAALGIPPTENAWAKYAFKLATGTGKTKCMSLAIVWSYFHALYEQDSDMTARLLVIAPGLTVYERLLEDFGGGKIFHEDPLIPHFEVEFARWLDYAEDVVAFAKNAGPQALRIDYLDSEGRISHYIPDFFVRDNNGDYFLVETKGYPDPNVEYKKKAAHSWCQSASKASGVSWTYLFVHQMEWNFSNFRSLAELILIATRMPS